MIDGPFGGVPQDLGIYEHALLIAGGSGVTFIVPILQDLVRRMNSNEGAVIRTVDVIWSIRDTGGMLFH